MKIVKDAVFGGRYRLVSQIAVGGMGEVWQAQDLVDSNLVAIKVLREDLAGQPTFLSRLEVEARNAARAQHPNLAAVLDSGVDGEFGWLVMELVPGHPLTDYLEGQRTLTVAQLLPLLYQTALALTAVHSANVVHRDIKPGNLLIDSSGVLKLTDFGISRADSQTDLTAAGMVMGTAQYLPPEQAKGYTATASGDLYSLGIIAYEALVGARPFTGDSQVDIAIAHVKQQVPPLPPGVPPLVRKLVMSLLAKDPAQRPPDAAALVRQIAYVAKQLDVSLDPQPLPDLEAPLAPPPVTDAQPPAINATAIVEQEADSDAEVLSETGEPGVAATTPPAGIPDVFGVQRGSKFWSQPPSDWLIGDPLPSREAVAAARVAQGGSCVHGGVSSAVAQVREQRGGLSALVQTAPVWFLAVLLVALLVVSLLVQFFVSSAFAAAAPFMVEGSSWWIQILGV